LPDCFFVSDLHGYGERYEKLFDLVARERPAALFVGGDILPTGLASYSGAGVRNEDFIHQYLVPGFERLRQELKEAYPEIFLILGNDDTRKEEESVKAVSDQGLWHYIHHQKRKFRDYTVYGYAFVPPTPFLLKDWERYDLSRYVDPGCVSPEEGYRSVPVSNRKIRYATIAKDLDALAGNDTLDRAILLFHTPPYQTNLDRAGLDGKMVDHVPLDVHVGSIAVKKFIEERKPLLTLHGHIHESAARTGSWRDRLGRTHCFSAAHGGPELAVVRFDPEDLDSATREVI
jgi:Icc-related predicted phosphoesterase